MEMADTAWQATVLTLFPQMFPGPLAESLAGKSLKEGIWALKTLDIRQFARDKHRTVDDVPLGGGVGMVLKPDVVAAALDHVADAPGPRIYLTPRGRVLDQPLVRELAGADGAVFLCGRYEGVDQRVIDAAGMMEVSIGDFILSGGEVAALTVMDSVVRLLPGVIGKEASHREESFETGLLEPSLYTHPRNWNGIEAPEILASGHHGRIAEWRAGEARRETRERRPDLWERYLQGQAREKEAKE
jgi:tRNA (guanine37-N1)-methyltransferase